MPDPLKALRDSLLPTDPANPEPGSLRSTLDYYGRGTPADGGGDPIVIAIGGMGSTPNDKFFGTIKSITPDAIQIHLKGQGMKKVNEDIRKAIETAKSQNRNYIVIGHSLGGSIAHGFDDPVNPDPKGNFIYVDPPYNPPWKGAPFSGKMSPVVDSINRASEGGIGYTHGTVKWTEGKTVMFGPNSSHSPWNAPDAPGNRERISELQNRLRTTFNAAVQRPVQRDVGSTVEIKTLPGPATIPSRTRPP